MTPPQPSPLGHLIYIAREGAGLSIREAARRAGVSESHWRHVESDYESKGGMQLPVNPRPRKIAQMAAVRQSAPGMGTSGWSRVSTAQKVA